MGKYVSIEAGDFKKFIDQLHKAAKGDFKKELTVFVDALATQFLSIVEDEIIERKSVDTRLLLASFQKSDVNNVYRYENEGLMIEVGTNVKYAAFVNDGHWLNPKGVSVRFVPGHWEGERFVYEPGANEGMYLKQKWIEGSHYFDKAVEIMEKMLPGLMERKIEMWLEQYFK